MSHARDVEILREALALERGAVERYVEQAAATADPRLFSFWESLRRNECGHRDALVAMLNGMGEDA
jgi:rubrerythrin